MFEVEMIKSQKQSRSSEWQIRGVPLHLMATFLMFKKQQIQGEGGRLRTSHQRSCVLEMVLFETQT